MSGTKAKQAPGLQSYIFTYADGTNTALGKVYGNLNSSGSWTAVSGGIYVYTGAFAGAMPLVPDPMAPLYAFLFLDGNYFYYFNDVLYTSDPSNLDIGGLMFANHFNAMNIFVDSDGLIGSFAKIGSFTGFFDNVGTFALITPQQALVNLFTDLATADPVSSVSFLYNLSDANAAFSAGNQVRFRRDMYAVQLTLSVDTLRGLLTPINGKILTNEVTATQGVLIN
jgi:hypothetical protein